MISGAGALKYHLAMLQIKEQVSPFGGGEAKCHLNSMDNILITKGFFLPPIIGQEGKKGQRHLSNMFYHSSSGGSKHGYLHIR